jgi:hypothetical protein
MPTRTAIQLLATAQETVPAALLESRMGAEPDDSGMDCSAFI